MTWDKQVLIHMDDAMRVPKTAGFFNTVAHHFYEARSRSLGPSPCQAWLRPGQPGQAGSTHVTDCRVHSLLTGQGCSLCCQLRFCSPGCCSMLHPVAAVLR